MKNLLLIALVALAFGCSKSSNPAGSKTSTTTTTASYSGKFHMYRRADTLFTNANINDGVTEINVESFGGDTSYFNPGTIYYRVDVASNYNPAIAMGDTLSFTSSTKGTNYDQFEGPIPFTYNFKTGLYTEDGEDPGETEVLSKINDSTLKLTITLTNLGYIRERIGIYYAKL